MRHSTAFNFRQLVSHSEKAPVANLKIQSFPNLPADLGSFSNIYKGNSAFPVIYVENPAPSPANQKKLMKLIEYLIAKENVPCVMAEGLKNKKLSLKQLETINTPAAKTMAAQSIHDFLRLNMFENAFMKRKIKYQIVTPDKKATPSVIMTDGFTKKLTMKFLEKKKVSYVVISLKDNRAETKNPQEDTNALAAPQLTSEGLSFYKISAWFGISFIQSPFSSPNVI